MATEHAIHPFERAGLGKAPFRFAGMIEQDLCYGEAILNRSEYERTGVRLTTKPGGSCDYCGTYIVHMFKVRSSDGRTFKVGCDCLSKVDAKLAAPALRAKKERDAKRRKAKREQKAVALRAKADAAAERLRAAMSDETAFRELPHPSVPTLTLRDYIDFVLLRGGPAAVLKAAKLAGVTE